MNGAIKQWEAVKSKETGEIAIKPKRGPITSTLFWLHGLGDSAEGFVPFFFSEDSPVPFGCQVRLLQAPRRLLSLYASGLELNAWYDIYRPEISEAAVSRVDIELQRDKILELIREEAIKLEPYGGMKRIAIGGFSQGCVLSLYIGLKEPVGLAGIIGLSGFKLPFLKYQPKPNVTLQQEDTRVLLVHGDRDQVIKHNIALESYQKDGFINMPSIKFITVQGMDHAVYPEAIEEMRKFLEQALPPILD